MCLLSALLIARDLGQAAKAERERRRSLVAGPGHSPTRIYTNRDLKTYHRSQSNSLPQQIPRSLRFTASERDIHEERVYWHREREKHKRELARLDARIRRTKWRLAERKARRRPGERLREDPAEKALEETLEGMEKERRKLISDFLERGRRAGALPGWLR
jgi:hypothetical protein